MAVAILSSGVTKICSKCRCEKPISEFGMDRATGDSLNRQCKECVQGCQQVRQTEVTERHRRFCEIYKTEIEEQKKKHDRVNTTKAIAARKYRHTFEGCLRSRLAAMRGRCDNPEDKDYVYYGARNIQCLFSTVEKLMDYAIHELELFVYDDIKNLVIHRIDNDGHYEPGNIAFVTSAEHARLHKEMRVTCRIS